MIRSHLMGTTALFFLFHTLLVAQGVLSQNCTEGCVDIQFKNTSCALQKEAGLCETPVLGAKFCPCTCNLCNYPEIVSESVEELKIAKVDEQYDLVEVESSPEPKSSVVDTLKDEVATITPAAAPTVSAPTTTTPTAAAPTLAAPTKAKSGVKCGSGQPNLLVIMTDDQGHDDISFYNKNGILHTPNMDKLAAQSVQFENFYTDSLCAPTRASLLTGRHHLKTGVWGVHGAMDYINLDETIIAEVLRDAGYDTAHFGKWHSGTTPGYNPWDRGFDLSYTTKLYTFFNTVVKKNGQEMETSGWIEDWLADKIIEYMRKKVKGDKPFFILWTPMSIHKGRKYDSEWYEDFIAPGQYYERYAGKVTRDLNHVFAALEYFDTVLGRVLNELHNLEIASETVVMFFGDNGPLLFDTDHQNGGPRHQRVPSDMKEQKGFIEENGIRNFLFVRGSGRYPAGKKVYQNVGVIDIYPTLLDITGVPVPKYNKPLDGVSFGPLLCEDGQWAHSERTLYFHETLKNTLGTDQILDLNANRQTDRYQKMLSYWEGGEWGAGFKYNSGLRHKQYKFIKTDVYDIPAQSYQEYDWNKLYWDNQKQAEKLSAKYQSQLVDWWQTILADAGSFRKPEFLIGAYKYSPVNAVGAIERTKFEIVVNDQTVSGFKNVGDFFTCRVIVKKTGWYNVNLLFGWNYYRGATIQISVGKDWQIRSYEAPSVKRQIDRNGPLGFGKIFLEESTGDLPDEMRVELVSRDFNDGGRVFWWVEAVEFVKI